LFEETTRMTHFQKKKVAQNHCLSGEEVWDKGKKKIFYRNLHLVQIKPEGRKGMPQKPGRCEKTFTKEKKIGGEGKVCLPSDRIPMRVKNEPTQ